MNKAVFLDRDGTLCKLVMHKGSHELEPAHKPEELNLMPNAINTLKDLQKKGYLLFLISNQPDAAKGKATLDQLRKVHKRFDQILRANGINFIRYSYCFHHPNGKIKEYSMKCNYRKPSPGFLIRAADDFSIELADSWIIGDRITDIECGKKVMVKTIFIGINKNKEIKADYIIKRLFEATKIINS